MDKEDSMESPDNKYMYNGHINELEQTHPGALTPVMGKVNYTHVVRFREFFGTDMALTPS